MTLSRREWLIALVLALLGALAWWYQGARAPEPLPDTPRQGRPEYVVEQIAAVTMSDQGQPMRRMRAAQLRAYPEGEGTELDLPRLRLLDPEEPDAPDWVVRSERAWVAPDEDEVLLEGRVHARRAAAAQTAPGPNLESTSEPAMDVYTSALLLLDDSGYAETDRFVELTRGGDWVTAVNGMKLWFRTPMRTRLYGRVRQRTAMAAGAAQDNKRAP